MVGVFRRSTIQPRLRARYTRKGAEFGPGSPRHSGYGLGPRKETSREEVRGCPRGFSAGRIVAATLLPTGASFVVVLIRNPHPIEAEQTKAFHRCLPTTLL